MTRKLVAALLAIAGTLSAGAAHAGHVNWSIGINVPGVIGAVANPGYYAAPAYAPAPGYYAPAPVYVEPAPVVYGYGAPVYVAPRVVYGPRYYGGYYGGGYYRGGYDRGYYRDGYRHPVAAAVERTVVPGRHVYDREVRR